jgi:adenine-specific DNA-methyltransferase
MGNRVFNRDALELWDEFDAAGLSAPAIFYADPPYSKEHYSRYYHVLETLDRYDYPESHGKGRYRQDRFRTRFSLKSEVADAVESLASAIGNRGGTLLLSYPSSGLLTRTLDVDIEEVLRQYFSAVKLVIVADAAHSTLGARHVSSHQAVVEYVWRAE